MSEIKTWQASCNEDFQKNGHDCSAQWEHVAREITELRAALADREWRLIESAPKNKDRVLIFSETYGVREARFHFENSEGSVWYDMMMGGGPMTIFYDVIRWMPLPKPPIDAMREGGD